MPVTTILIVVLLLALGVGIVVWATRRTPSTPTTNAPGESDTAWNDPLTPGAPAGREQSSDPTPRS